jgi:hypothetical protein
MPLMKIGNATMQVVRAKRPRGYELSGTILRFDDGAWLVEVSDDVTTRVAAERVHGESDEGVIGRLLQEQ